MKTPPILAGRIWAYVGTIGGVGASAAVNYAETIGNPDVPAGAAAGAALLMALLPIGLFVALEVLVRNRIKEHLLWWRGGMMVTALAFAVPSYSHMHDLLVEWGQNDAISYLTPFGFDGLMLLSTLALLLDPAAEAEGTGAPASRFEYILSIPAAPAATRTLVLETKAAEVERVVPAPKAPKPPKEKSARRGGSATRRFARPEDHPLFAAWQREDWSDEEFAARSGKSVGAARAQAGRWRKHLAERPPVSRNQMELIDA